MVLFQAILLLLRRFLGKMVEALFGWAAIALFGYLAQSKRVIASLAIGLAAAWPLLLVGVAFPRAATFLVAFVPLSDRIPAAPLRIGWIALALLVPLFVGFAVSRGLGRRPARHLLQGYPITVGLGGAFLIAIAVVPVQKLIALLRHERSEHVPLAIPGNAYDEVAAELRHALAAGGIDLEPGTAPLPSRAMSAIARRLGGRALSPYFPASLAHFRGHGLSLTLYPHGATLYGGERNTAKAHILISEAAVRTRALETTTPDAQRVERTIRRVGGAIERSRSPERASALARKVLKQVAASPLPYEDWQVLHRQALQLLQSAAGEPTPARDALRGGARHREASGAASPK